MVPPLEKPFTDGILDTLRGLSRPATPPPSTSNPVLCPDCADLPAGDRHDTVVWKDPDHVTGTFLENQREQIWSRLVTTGMLDP